MVFHVAINQMYVLGALYFQSQVKEESLQTMRAPLFSWTTKMKSQCKQELVKGRWMDKVLITEAGKS